MNEHYKEKTCPECSKVFYPEYLLKWGWKNPKDEPVCSYTCQRKSEKKHYSRSIKKPCKTTVRIIETGEIFQSITACANSFDVKVMTLRYYIDKGKPFRGLHIERVVI